MAIADQDNNSSPRASNNLKVASLRGEAAAASNANCITNPHQSRIEETYTNNSPIAGLGGHLLGGAHSASDMASEMEYAWLEPRHDPIVTDTNFAEIDFENFKNEDLAYAFSCGEEESGGSSTDMSICRSEPLFSSMRDSEMQNVLKNSGLGGHHHHHQEQSAHAAVAAAMRLPTQDSSLIQDSLTDVDFNFGEKVTVNKNNYTLTYSGQGVIGSFMASMVSSAGVMLEPQDSSKPLECRYNERSLESPGKLTTWSSLGKSNNTTPPCSNTTSFQHTPPTPVLWQSRNREELNNNGEIRKSKSLPEPEATKDLVNTFMRGRSPQTSGCAAAASETTSTTKENNDSTEIPMMRSKDTVNQFLKTNSRLTSIEEQAEGGYTSSSRGSSSPASSSSATLRTANGSSSSPCGIERPLTLPKPTKIYRKNSGKLTTLASMTPNSSKNNIIPQQKYAYPDLNFLENDVGLWDTFFCNKSKFQSVLRPPLPIEEYLKNQQQPRPPILRPEAFGPAAPGPVVLGSALGQEPLLLAEAAVASPPAGPSARPPIHDTDSLRTLLPAAQKHLLPVENPMKASPITQVCQSLSKLHNNERSYSKDIQNDTIKTMFASNQEESKQVKQAWTSSTEAPMTSFEAVRRRKKSQDRNLNLINNNGDSIDLKRRSYHPQDYLSQVLEPKPVKRKDFPKSGSQNDLIDSWRNDPPINDEDSSANSEAVNAANAKWMISGNGNPTTRNLSAEYPFHKNLCMPPQGINFDLTHKRGLFVNLYSAVERLLMYQDDSTSETSVRFVLFHELCPALVAILKDGLKTEVITSFGRMKTNVWRVIEAVIRQGPAFGGGAATSDLVMLLNAKFPASGDDHRKFAGFVAGLLNMSSLHVWFSKLKWSMDVLLRFYERHAFICALHKETRLLFDELVFCLQRLYSVPIHIDLPFANEILDDIALTPSSQATSAGAASGTLASTPASCGTSYDLSEAGTSSGGGSGTGSGGRMLIRRPSSSGSSGKSRIPRPISLPKRLECKLSSTTTTPAPTSSTSHQSPVRTSSSSSKPTLRPFGTLASGPVRPTSGDRRNSKSRVRDTVKLFDSKASTTSRASRGPATTPRRTLVKAPKNGAGEAMALEDTGGTRC